MMDLGTRTHWIFDMDGTLTQAVLDFVEIKDRLGLPQGRGILEVLEEMPADEAAEIGVRLEAIELEYAALATAAVGAHDLLGLLQERGVALGILTRNKRSIAFETLRVTGMLDFFADDHILGRDEATPKPSPEGLQKLLKAWGADPGKATMTGDYRFDLEAGRAAGAATIYVDPSGSFPFRDLADVAVRRLDELVGHFMVGVE